MKDKKPQIHIGTIGPSGHGEMGLFHQIDRAFEAEIEKLSGIKDKNIIGKIRGQFELEIEKEILFGSEEQWPKENPIGLMAATGTCSDVKFDKQAFEEMIEEVLKAKVVAHPHIYIKPGEMVVEDHEKAREECPFYPSTRRGKTVHFNPADRERLAPVFKELHIPIEEDYKP